MTSNTREIIKGIEEGLFVLEDVIDEMNTAIALALVKINGELIEFIKAKYRSLRVRIAAVRNTPYAMLFLTDRQITREVMAEYKAFDS